MEFKLPFPTLKSLSSLRICLHWADHELGPFQEFSTTMYSDKITLCERNSPLSIDGLQISCSLKAVVGDVLNGIFEQLTCFWWNYSENRLVKEVQLFHFDAYGRFDVKRTLKPIFQKKVAEKNDFFSLHRLLKEAYDFWLLPEVDAIFRKMVATAGKIRRSEILMEGPQPELRHGQFHLVYRFVQEDASRYLTLLHRSNCADAVIVVLERESIAIAPFPGTRYWNFDAFKDHFDLLFESPEREAFIEDVLNDDNMYLTDIKNLLDIFTFLKQNNYQRNWMLGPSDPHFRRLLIWPFTSCFIVAFEYLAPHLTSDDYLIIFSLIVETMPAEEQHGVLHRSLLVYYWSVLTADQKRECTTLHPYYFYKVVDALKVKAPFLHDTIKTEMDSHLFFPSPRLF